MAKKKQRVRRRATQHSVSKSKIPMGVWFVGGTIGLLILVAGLLYLGEQGQNPAIVQDIEGLIVSSNPGRDHVEGDVDYHDDVPAGGEHSSAWLNCGIYDEPVLEENAVHSMEHGAVWLTYGPELPQEQVDILRDVVRQERSRRGEPMIILSPRENLDAPIVATAWRVQLNLEDATDDRLNQFVRRFQRGPFTPEPGAPCWNGVGEPLS
jgi:hypothetical protein